MNSLKWVKDGCVKAIFVSSMIRIEAAGTNKTTVAGWNNLLRENYEHFVHPNPSIHKQETSSQSASILSRGDNNSMAAVLY
jgi:hypothetical protein